MSNGINFWISFWTFFLFASLAIFACLAVVVSIGGFFNILSLFRKLTNQAEQQDESSCADRRPQADKKDD